MLNDRLLRLMDYPFTRLAELVSDLKTPEGVHPLALSVGEPQHAAPAIVDEALHAHRDSWNRYPPIHGTDRFRTAVVNWLNRRYGLPSGLIDPDRGVLPVSGTREALFLTALLTVPQHRARQTPAVLLPNPFYAPYQGAAVAAGAEPVFLDAGAETGYLPDLDALPPELLDRTALFYLCSPSNPQGAVADLDYLRRALGLARQHGFVLAVDECYAEIYGDTAPPGGLAACDGRVDNLLVFHSLSKRSNAAGLRSGFVAGDPGLVAAFRQLRSYGGAGMPLPIQAASAALWDDDDHVVENRRLYREKFDAAERVLAGRFGFYRPAGGFFLWLDVGDGEAAAKALWCRAGLRVLPGSYLSHRRSDGGDPGHRYIRVALVHDTETVAAAMTNLATVLETERVDGPPQPMAAEA